MSRSAAVFLSVSLLLANPALAQNADLGISIKAASTYNAGEISTLTATVTNYGPDTASVAGVRLANPSNKYLFAEKFGCIQMPDSVLCNVPTLAAGASHVFTVPFVTPPAAGPITLSARTESFTVDPNSQNNSVVAVADVVEMPDLKAELGLFPSLQYGKTSRLRLLVSNLASTPATRVTALITLPSNLLVTDVDGMCENAGGNELRCMVGPQVNQTPALALYFDVVPAADAPPAMTFSASVESAESDWNPADNSATIIEPVFALASLESSLSASEHMDDDNRGTLRFTITNTTDVDAPGPVALIQLGNASVASWEASGWTCSRVEATDLRCSAPVLARRSSSVIVVTAQYAAHEIRGVTRVSLSQNPPDPGFKSMPQVTSLEAVFYRDYDVTTTADGGPGSLRQAIIDANSQCSGDLFPPPCRIAMRIPSPVPQEGWFTIEPLSPLPTITVTDLTIDGTLQTALTGNTNPDGPEIFVLGSRAGDTDGFRLISGLETIRGLAIGGFTQNAILSLPRFGNLYFAASSFRHTIAGNYLGVDPGGSRAVPNRLRGLMAYRFHGTISGNVISGNRRSGIYLSGAEDTMVADNRIGVAATTDDPVPNGATGVFFIDTVPFQEVRVEHNLIANNAEYGISTSRLSRISIYANRIVNNRTSIDLGLDGPTAEYINGYIAPQPRISSARYDAASGRTVIEGTVPKQSPTFGYAQAATVYLYANRSLAEEGDQFIGSAPADLNGRYTLAVQRDLRGQFIVGTTYMTVDYGDLFVRMSSEFGRVVPVE